MNLVLEPLRSFMHGRSKSSARKFLSSFECARDEDVTYYLKMHAMHNEVNGASRAYLVLDDDVEPGEDPRFVAFFALAVTVTDFSEVDEATRKDVMGTVPGWRSSDHFAGYLLAQLARDDRCTHDDFDAAELILAAENFVEASVETVGGRVLYLDCKEQLVGYYERQGYGILYRDDDKGLYKMFKCFAIGFE